MDQRLGLEKVSLSWHSHFFTCFLLGGYNTYRYKRLGFEEVLPSWHCLFITCVVVGWQYRYPKTDLEGDVSPPLVDRLGNSWHSIFNTFVFVGWL
jgi:hypothetical protein